MLVSNGRAFAWIGDPCYSARLWGSWCLAEPKARPFETSISWFVEPFVFESPAGIRLFLTRRERWIFNNCGLILTLIIDWLRLPLFLLWCSKGLTIWSEGLVKDLYQKNSLPPVRLAPTIYRLQVWAFYQLSYPGLSRHSWPPVP